MVASCLATGAGLAESRKVILTKLKVGVCCGSLGLCNDTKLVPPGCIPSDESSHIAVSLGTFAHKIVTERHELPRRHDGQHVVLVRREAGNPTKLENERRGSSRLEGYSGLRHADAWRDGRLAGHKLSGMGTAQMDWERPGLDLHDIAA